jgi:hypothetical protein
MLLSSFNRVVENVAPKATLKNLPALTLYAYQGEMPGYCRERRAGGTIKQLSNYDATHLNKSKTEF